MAIAMTDEQRALQEALRSWAETTDTTAVRSREPGAGGAFTGGAHTGSAHTGSADAWNALADIGVFSVALDEQYGGASGSVADLAAALEQAAAALTPGPVLSTALAGVLLNRHQVGAGKLLSQLAEGKAAVAVCLEPGSLVAQRGEGGRGAGGRDEGGGFTVSGSAGPVWGGDEASHLLLCALDADNEQRWFVVDAQAAGVERTGLAAVDFSRSLSRVTLRDAAIGPEDVVAGLTSAEVNDLAVTLACAEAVGVAGWCLHTAVEYAKTREQFGAVIGTFQAVKHLCANMLCRVEQATALAWDAARTVDEEPDEHPLAAAAAGAVVLDAAVDTAKDCIQVLGGTGFTWEHDAHLYLRRALALRQLLGGSARYRQRTAELTLAGHRRNLRVARELPPEVEAQRESIRSIMEEIARLPAGQQRVRLGESGYLAPHWPRPYGHVASPALQLVIDEEMQRAGIERPDMIIGGWAVPTILEHGTADQRELAWPTLRGEISWCQLFSEPGAGSDLASLRTRAERVDGGWVLNGQKVWTSLAREADWAICLARTDPDAPKHKGITYFLVDMASEGIEVRPLRELTGVARFNEVFLENVFVPDANVVGSPGEGWQLARTTLANERLALSGGSSLGSEVERLVELARAHSHGESGLDSVVSDRIGAMTAQGLSVSLLSLRSAMRALEGGQGAAQERASLSSVEKLLGVRHRQSVSETALDLLGPDGASVQDDMGGSEGTEGTGGSEGTGAVVHEFLITRCLSIAGGTTEILLTAAAERVLGLPRK